MKPVLERRATMSTFAHTETSADFREPWSPEPEKKPWEAWRRWRRQRRQM
jgi:hypothetical protein